MAGEHAGSLDDDRNDDRDLLISRGPVPDREIHRQGGATEASLSISSASIGFEDDMLAMLQERDVSPSMEASRRLPITHRAAHPAASARPRAKRHMTRNRHDKV